MSQYSDESESESESDCEVDVVLKALPKENVVVKAKRTYVRKQPITDESKQRTADKLQKARAAKTKKRNHHDQKSKHQ